jgi:hypothetical protein
LIEASIHDRVHTKVLNNGKAPVRTYLAEHVLDVSVGVHYIPTKYTINVQVGSDIVELATIDILNTATVYVTLNKDAEGRI